jgi:hypothetical protein
MTWTAKARKSTVTKQGVRGETYRATRYTVVLPNGQKVIHADKDTAIRVAEGIVAKWANR